jgi:hypothetical protein
MTQSLNNVAVQQFSDNFINIYQANKSLVGQAAQIVRGVVGNAYVWKLIGTADLQQRSSFQSVVPATDVSHIPKSCTKTDYILNLPTDIFEQAEVNASERDALSTVHANAISRREDKFVIDALNASATTNVIVNGSTNLTLGKILTAAYFLNVGNVDSVNRHIAVHANQLNAILRIEQLTNFDYTSVKALVNGEINTFNGFTWHVFGDRFDQNGLNMGLPKTGNIRTCFAWHQSAVGVAQFIAPLVTVDWDPTIQSWLSISKMSAGSIALQDAGVVKIDCDETAGVGP